MKRRKVKKKNDFVALLAFEEYGHAVGGFVWIIFTDIPEDILIKKYSQELSLMKPYIILSKEHYRIIAKFNNIEEKHNRWSKRHLSRFNADDPDFYEHHPEQAYENDLIGQIMLKDQIMEIFKYMEKLTDLQKSRLSKYFLEEKTFDEIAQEEGVSRQVVMLTIDTAIKKLKKMLK